MCSHCGADGARDDYATCGEPVCESCAVAMLRPCDDDGDVDEYRDAADACCAVWPAYADALWSCADSHVLDDARDAVAEGDLVTPAIRRFDSVATAKTWAGSKTIRAPHYSASIASIVGHCRIDDDGVTTFFPGELSLCGQRGLLLLTEFEEWKRPTIEAIGLALRSGYVRAGNVRVRIGDIAVGVVGYGCPCGMSTNVCRCTKGMIDQWHKRRCELEALLRGEVVR